MGTDLCPPLSPPLSITLRWRTEADAQACAARLARSPSLRSAFIDLHGDLGAGKTTFARHLLRALGVSGRVKSPTFTVLEPYEVAGGLTISHFDFYRFADPREWDDAGFRDVFAGTGLKLTEWAEKAGPHLPGPDLRLSIRVDDDGEQREVQVQAFSEAGVALLQSLSSNVSAESATTDAPTLASR